MIENWERDDGFAYSQDVLEHVKKLHHIQFRDAATTLHCMNRHALAIEAEKWIYNDPPENWLRSFVSRYDLHLTYGIRVDSNRIGSCNRDGLRNFMIQHQQLINSYNKCNVWNADETSCENRKKLCKVVANHPLPIVPNDVSQMHITAMCAINGVYDKMQPFFILPNLQNIPNDLSDLTGYATFASSFNGWMTEATFYAWSIHFCHHLSCYRATFPGTMIGNQRVLFILDGHSSRISAFALLYLKQHYVDVLILPSHTTHILQPFDVVVAHSLKACIRKICQNMQSL